MKQKVGYFLASQGNNSTLGPPDAVYGCQQSQANAPASPQERLPHPGGRQDDGAPHQTQGQDTPTQVPSKSPTTPYVL